MPAAAVIPAPIAYIKVVAVKKLVVGFRGAIFSFACAGCGGLSVAGLCLVGRWLSAFFCGTRAPLLSLMCGFGSTCWGLYFEKIRVFKAGIFFA